MPLLRSSDDTLFRLPVQLAQRSRLLRNLLEDSGGFEAEESTDPTPRLGEEAIPLQNVKGSILEKVIEWLYHHKDRAMPEDDENNKLTDEVAFRQPRHVEISDWDRNFMDVDQDMLFELILVKYKTYMKGTDHNELIQL